MDYFFGDSSVRSKTLPPELVFIGKPSEEQGKMVAGFGKGRGRETETGPFALQTGHHHAKLSLPGVSVLVWLLKK